MRECFVKASGGGCGILVRQRANHVAEVDLAGVCDMERIRLARGMPQSKRFEFHRSLPFVAGFQANAEDRGHSVEQASAG